MERITVKGTSFIDESGRERIFNGVNLVNKGYFDETTGKIDYYRVNWDEEMFSKLAASGVNLIRFGLVWNAIEPLPGKYNNEYLDFMGKYIDLCEKYGIYVYLDIHQDCFHGMPDWATVTDSYKRRKPVLIWAEGYFIDKAVHRAFDNFWANTPVAGKGLQDYFADMWKHIVLYYKDKNNIFGYDILNEPFPGTSGGKVFRKIISEGAKTILSNKVDKKRIAKSLFNGNVVNEVLSVMDRKDIIRSFTSGGDLIIKNFDVDKYYPFLKKIASAIREVTKDGIIIMEACYYSNTSIPCSTPRLRYDDGTVEENLAFAPHGYDITVDSVYTNTAGNNRVDAIFDEHAKTQKRLGVPLIVGEWGGMVPGSEEYPHLEHLLEYFDNNRWSQTYWCFWKELIDEKIMKIIARPVPVAVPGQITKYEFNRHNNTFTLKFNCETGSRKKAIIYSPSAPKRIEAKCKSSYESIAGSQAVTISVGVSKGENKIIIEI